MNKHEKLTTFSQVLLWFGAAVSIAEIMTGALLAPLGLSKGIVAIILGHVIGAFILYPAGLIGARSGLSSIESTRISFGSHGSYVFSVLNVLQLLGWTAIMIVNGAKAFDGITQKIARYQNEQLWCIIIGFFICLWVAIGIKNLSKVNVVVVTALFLFTIVLGVTVFTKTGNHPAMMETISFGAAVELNVTMALSWLPVISDYTRDLENPVQGTIGSVLSYTLGSCFMFIIGLGAAVYAGSTDVFAVLTAAGLGFVACIIIFFSTVTTTFLDVYSAGVSASNLNRKMNEKIAAVVLGIMGIIIALFVSMDLYEDFLYLIGSVFAPLFAILFVDYFYYGKTKINERCLLNMKNAVLWVIGFVVYRFLMVYHTPVGITFPVMLVIGVLCLIVNTVQGKRK